MAGALVPEDDLYARLEVAVDASPEAIELAWRALLKRHHPDVAGDTLVALERAKRINVAHDWLSDSGLRARYDRERLGLGAIPPGRARTGVRHGRPPRAWPPQPAHRPTAARARRSTRPDLVRGDPAQRLERFLDRVTRLSGEELDRLAAAEPPPIAFLATIRRFVTPEAAAEFEATEAAVAARVPARALGGGRAPRRAARGRRGARPVAVPRRHAGRAVPRPGARPAAAGVGGVHRPAALRAQRRRGGRRAGRVATMTTIEAATLVRASVGGGRATTARGRRPWTATRTRRSGSPRCSRPVTWRRHSRPDGLTLATAARARRLLARVGHVEALPQAFPAATFTSLTAPSVRATRASAEERPREGTRGPSRPLALAPTGSAAAGAAAAARLGDRQLARRAERSMSGRASAGLVALMIALIMPSATSCGRGDRDVREPDRLEARRGTRRSTARRRCSRRRSRAPRAPSGVSASSATMSLMPIRPPGRSTRAISREHGRLVGRQVDDAVADDDVDRLGRQRERLDVALEELDVRGAGLGGVRLGQRQHLVGHVEAEGAAGRPDPLGREQDVDATAGARGRGRARPGGGPRRRSGCRSRARRGRPRPAARRARGRSTGSAPIVSGSLQHEAPWEARTRGVGVVLAGRSRGWSRWSWLRAPRCCGS